MISRPHRLTTEGTMPPKWLESTGGRWGRTRCRTCHGTSFPLSSLPIVSGTYDRRLAQFAILEKKDHTAKNVLLVNALLIILLLSDTHGGRTHDLRMGGPSPHPPPPGSGG